MCKLDCEVCCQPAQQKISGNKSACLNENAGGHINNEFSGHIKCLPIHLFFFITSFLFLLFGFFLKFNKFLYMYVFMYVY